MTSCFCLDVMLHKHCGILQLLRLTKVIFHFHFVFFSINIKVTSMTPWYKLFCNSNPIISFIISVTFFSAGNNILNPSSHRDQMIPLFSGHFKFQAVSWYLPKNQPKTAFPAIFHDILLQNIASFLNFTRWHWKSHLSLNVSLKQVKVQIFHRTGISMFVSNKQRKTEWVPLLLL